MRPGDLNDEVVLAYWIQALQVLGAQWLSSLWTDMGLTFLNPEKVLAEIQAFNQSWRSFHRDHLKEELGGEAEKELLYTFFEQLRTTAGSVSETLLGQWFYDFFLLNYLMSDVERAITRSSWLHSDIKTEWGKLGVSSDALQGIDAIRQQARVKYNKITTILLDLPGLEEQAEDERELESVCPSMNLVDFIKDGFIARIPLDAWKEAKPLLRSTEVEILLKWFSDRYGLSNPQL